MFAMPIKAPSQVDVLEVQNYILIGRSNRIRMGKSDPYADVRDSSAAILKDAQLITDSYNERIKKIRDGIERNALYKEIVMIQFGYDPVPRVGDFYEGHTITEIIENEFTVEIYGVSGKIPSKELKAIIEEAKKPEVLRDRMKRRGYRFAVLEKL